MPLSSTRPMVSVVIPHYGGKDVLSECLISLKNCTYPDLEIIVVDNDSPDDSAQFITDNFYEVNLILTLPYKVTVLQTSLLQLLYFLP